MNIEQEMIRALALGDVQKALSLSHGTKYHPNIQESIKFLSSRDSYREVYSSDLEDIDIRIPGQFINGGPDPRQTAIIEHVSKLTNRWRLLDIGCADGSLINYLLNKSLIKYAHGVDAWENGIKYAKSYFANRKDAEFTCSLAEEYYSNDLYDIIVMGEILEHVIDPRQLFLKAHSLLGPERHLIVTVPIDRPPVSIQEEELLLSGKPNLHVRLFNIDTIYKMSKQHGFEFRRMEIEGNHWKNLVLTLQKV